MMEFNTREEAEKYLQVNGSDTFEGMNCDEDCTGWDGESRRCNCGNRRVQLISEQNQEGKWFAYGEAY